MNHLDLDDVSARRGYIPGLDGLRAISISAVLFGHMFLPKSVAGFSAIGVYMFFVISGFLITRLLLAERKQTGTVNLPDFYVRRLLRLYPVLVLYIAAICIVTLLAGNRIPLLEVVSVFGYFTNYLEADRIFTAVPTYLPISVLWSLSVEEHFYFFAPITILLLKGDARRILIFFAALTIFCLALRGVYMGLWPEIIGTDFNYLRSETRFDSIAWGVMLAAVCELRGGARVIRALLSPYSVAAALVLLAGSYVIRDPLFKDTLRFTIRSATMLPLVCAAIFTPDWARFKAVLNSAPFIWVGRLSYSLYIWHEGSLYLLRMAGIVSVRGIARSFAELAITILLAIASYYLVELRFMRLRKRVAHANVPPESIAMTVAQTDPVEPAS